MYPTNYLGCMTPFKAIAYLRKTKNKHRTMQNVSYKKKWNAGLVQLHVDPPPITLIKSKHDDKLSFFNGIAKGSDVRKLGPV